MAVFALGLGGACGELEEPGRLERSSAGLSLPVDAIGTDATIAEDTGPWDADPGDTGPVDVRADVAHDVDDNETAQDTADDTADDDADELDPDAAQSPEERDAALREAADEDDERRADDDETKRTPVRPSTTRPPAARGG
ncbi:MAG: hypothetical protein KC468_27710 [Myxococcales bacterium]|nr:hypothetical protein [Myxococcales bacterium]